MTYGEKHKIKTYLVPTTYEMVEAMEKGEAPSFLHVGTCLDGLTNGEALCMLFPNMHYTLSDKSPRVVTTIGVASSFDLDWWNSKWEVSE